MLSPSFGNAGRATCGMSAICGQILRFSHRGIPGPSGKGYGASTLHGNRERGTGILNNELYIGRQIWNRLNYAKDPDTGKRISRLNPAEDWVISDVPELRIIEQSLWDAFQVQQRKSCDDEFRRRCLNKRNVVRNTFF